MSRDIFDAGMSSDSVRRGTKRDAASDDVRPVAKVVHHAPLPCVMLGYIARFVPPRDLPALVATCRDWEHAMCTPHGLQLKRTFAHEHAPVLGALMRNTTRVRVRLTDCGKDTQRGLHALCTRLIDAAPWLTSVHFAFMGFSAWVLEPTLPLLERLVHLTDVCIDARLDSVTLHAEPLTRLRALRALAVGSMLDEGWSAHCSRHRVRGQPLQHSTPSAAPTRTSSRRCRTSRIYTSRFATTPSH
jgi:hypothetical protein